MEKKSVLYIVSTPIGNNDDISLRAIETIKKVDALICEEYKNGSRLLRKLGVEQKEIIALNEHNEEEQLDNILIRMANGQSLALVSDCGTPLFSDPGHKLEMLVVSAGFKITPVPGVSSLATIISVTPIKLEEFVFGGFLPRTANERISRLKKYKAMKMPVILMDTPYRMGTLLENVKNVYGKGQTLTIGCDLTMENEMIITDSCEEIMRKVGNRKAEFMLVIH